MPLLKVGKRDVVESGSVLVDWRDVVEIQLQVLKFKVIFLEKQNEGQHVNLVAELGQSTLRVELINLNNALGTAYGAQVGEINDQPLAMHLMVHAIGDFRLLSYTFLAG